MIVKFQIAMSSDGFPTVVIYDEEYADDPTAGHIYHGPVSKPMLKTIGAAWSPGDPPRKWYFHAEMADDAGKQIFILGGLAKDQDW